MRRQGREKLHFLNPVPIRLIHDWWIDKYTETRRRARTVAGDEGHPGRAIRFRALGHRTSARSRRGRSRPEQRHDLLGSALLACVRAGDPREMDDLVEACERLVDVHADVPAWRAALAMLHARREDHEAAREHYELLARDRFRAIPRDFVWLNAITYMAETCAFLEDAERASMLSEILDPYANRVALIDRALACKGSVLRFLGLLAVVADDFDTAERHLSGALQRHEGMGAEPLETRTREELAYVRTHRASSAAR